MLAETRASWVTNKWHHSSQKSYTSKPEYQRVFASDATGPASLRATGRGQVTPAYTVSYITVQESVIGKITLL